MRHLVSTPVLLLCFFGVVVETPAQYAGSKPVPAHLKKGFEDISEKSCRTWLTKLASDEFEGRGSGSPGYQKAAEFMAARFKEFGLQPKGDNGTWFQGVPFKGRRVVDEKSYLEFGQENGQLASGVDVSFSPARAEREASVVFVVARGLKARLKNDMELRGKVVIVKGLHPRNFRLWRQLSTRTAAMLQVADEVSKSSWRTSRGRSRSRVTGNVTAAAATRLAEALGSPRALTTEVGDDEVVVIPAGDEEVRIVVEMESRSQPVPNVVGYLEGSDPKLRHEVVIMGSHLDHLGRQGATIYNGADDDGSGSTALLAVARAFTKNGKRPRRSLLFLAFCGEELGLVGSSYYVNNPIIPIEDSVCELQMDMVGRNEESRRTGEKPEDNVQTTHLVGSKRLSMDLHEIVLAMNQHVNFTFEYDEESVYERSDHAMFARKGIPVAFFFSGFHPDYHRPTDTVEKINFEKLGNTARLVYLTAYTVADRPERLVLNERRK